MLGLDQTSNRINPRELLFTTVNTVIYAVEELLAKAMFMFFRQLGGSAQFCKSDISGATNPIKYAGCTVGEIFFSTMVLQIYYVTSVVPTL